jgi:small subunit ribosomal protein S24e
MEIEIVQKKDNPLFKRVDVDFRVKHPGEATPKREDVREKLAAQLNSRKTLIVVDEMTSRFGRGETQGHCRVYEDVETLGDTEPGHLIKRNNLQDAVPKKGKKAAAESQ